MNNSVEIPHPITIRVCKTTGEMMENGSLSPFKVFHLVFPSRRVQK